MIKDCKSGREIDIRESFLIVKGRIYAKESYIAFDTTSLKAYPPVMYYDREDEYLGSFGEERVYEFSDVEDDLLSYSDYCFSNHDLDDLRSLIVKKREEFVKKLIK